MPGKWPRHHFLSAIYQRAVPLHTLRITITAEGRSWLYETLRPQRPLQPGEVTR